MVNNGPANIKEFSYKLTSYLKWVNEFATVFGCEVKNNSLSFSPTSGKGNSTAYFLEKGLTACVNNYRLDEEYLLCRQPSDSYGMIIYLYHLEADRKIEYTLADVPINLDFGSNYLLSFVNAETTHQMLFAKDTSVRGISFFVDNGWLSRNFSQGIPAALNYLQQVNFLKQFVNAKQKKLLTEILEISPDHPCPDLYIRSRMLRIFDKLLENLLQRDIPEAPEKMNEDDFNAVQRVEALLTASYSEAFPGIEKLSRLALMSESKLKKLFKQSFGMGLYEYYQRNRMHRAKAQIISGKYSISEVGAGLGYHNLSNFSAAFKKEFNCLPSELGLN
jgi:AraC-like DNA-binding protein